MTHFSIALGERQSQPRHFFVILLEFRLVLVRAHKDDLKVFLRMMFLVEFCQFGRETATRRTPMCGEVEADRLAFATDALNSCVRSLQCVAKKTLENISHVNINFGVFSLMKLSCETLRILRSQSLRVEASLDSRFGNPCQLA